MKYFLFLLATIILMIVLVNSCKHAIPEPPQGVNNGGNGGAGGTGSTAVCFESEILPLFQSNCAKSGCHDAATAEKGYVLDSYQNIIRKKLIPGNATNSEIYAVLFETGNDKMPPPPNPDLTVAQKALIGRWINEGARNTNNCGTNCDINNFKYGANISTILGSHCTGCHGGNTPAANINLTNHAGVAAVALNGRLYGAITHSAGYSPMPKNASKLSDCQITQVKNWVDAGAPNN